jgi:hypothetical protein
MVFHRGGVLDRLFDGDRSPALEKLRAGLQQGSDDFSAEDEIAGALKTLAKDLRGLRVLEGDAPPTFEVGGVSEQAMLRALRLALPALPDLTIPLARQGRGIQRLVLLAALLRLAQQTDQPPPIGAFEEPEEALEPVRQSQVAAMVTGLAEKGGQVLVVTHSPDFVRPFAVEDLHLVGANPRGTIQSLRDCLSPQSRQGYERRLDGPVVQALFANLPVLVEGPSDRAMMTVFWDALADANAVEPRYAQALEFVNCESGSHQAEMARLLHEAGKPTVAWAESDTKHELKKLRDGGHCARLVVYPDDPARENLEAVLSRDCSLRALGAGLTLIASTRGYSWQEQRDDLLARLPPDTDPQIRETAKASKDVAGLFATLEDSKARNLIRAALQAKSVAPFEMKGARPARLMAETIVQIDGVPASFAAPMQSLDEWAKGGYEKSQSELAMPA